MTSSARRASNRTKVQTYRERLRRQGLRPVQIWTPDVDSPRFRAEAKRQSRQIATSEGETDDQAFVDSIASDLADGDSAT